MDKKILKFDLSPKDIQIKKILNKEFLEMEIYAISDIYPNRNDSHFTLDSMENSKGSFYNKPILGYFNNFSNDFEEHNGKQAFDRELEEKYWDCNGIKDERILGLIRESDNIEIIKIDDVNWIKVTCAIWTQYSYRQVKRLLKSKSKKVSVEIEVSKWHYDENKILIIDEFNVTGITILGDKISEGIPGAHLNVLEIIQSQNYSEKVQCLTFAYKKSEKDFDEKEDKEKKEEVQPKEEGIEDDESDTIKFDLNDEELTEEKTEEDDSHLDKNFKGLEEYKLTYQEKRNLLDTAMRKFDPEYKEFYVVDFSDEFVIINNYCENKYYKISYTMEIENDGEKDTAKFSFDFENKQEVESSWKPATGVDVESKRFVTVEDQELDIDQLLQKYIELKEGCGCENSDKIDDDIEEKEEDGGAEEEDEKEEEKECNLAEETNEESEEENSEKECDMANEKKTEENFEEENSEKECDMAEEEPSEDEEDSEENKSEEECDRYAELEEKYNQLTKDYSSLNSQFAEVNAKYTDLFNQVEQAEREKIRDFGISMAESEDELDKDDKNNIIEKCKKFEYSSTEEIEDDIAKMLYQKKKSNRQRNFKSNVVISQNISHVNETSKSNDRNDVWDRWGKN